MFLSVHHSPARWQNGYAADCKSVNAGSIPARASRNCSPDPIARTARMYAMDKTQQERGVPPSADSLSDLVDCLPELHAFHQRSSKTYQLLDRFATYYVHQSNLGDPERGAINFRQFGEIKFPYFKMGNIDSIHLFGLDELILFSFYLANKDKYARAADLGANIGLHSIVMGRCGWNVTAYEPDPKHYDILSRNLALNEIKSVQTVKAAVSDKDGTSEFVRVVGNTTSSHLAGAKDNAYGELEKFEVKTVAVDKVFQNIDFIKMDVEGAESAIITATGRDHWAKTDMMLEVGNAKSAQSIFEHLKKIRVYSFSQKTNWNRVEHLSDIPISYKEGSLFISSKPAMFWG
jgi:FkbM family methyltransferase